jgi:WhiB family redox-sensing transcriptional regulator
MHTRIQDRPGHWAEAALCAQTDPELFFPDKGGTSAPAKRICAGCLVRAECLQDALDRGERFGIRGGLSERQRRRLAKRPVPAARCPRHGLDLTGGPVLYHCPARHNVTAADLQNAAGAVMPQQAAA